MRNLASLVSKVQKWTARVCRAVDTKYKQQLGVSIKDTTADKLVNYMYMPKDSSSLAVTRILFGLAMLLDIPDERGGATMEKRWGDPMTCHFPLLPFIKAVPLHFMAVIYGILWISALGLTLGYKYRWSSVLFVICYWYLLLIEKSFWNNHSYLFGLVSFLLMFTEAGSYWSIDAYKDQSKRKETVPYWNYFILKYQFFILYFMAGLKKGTAEWLSGYSVMNLSEHWVFAPFKLFLSVPQIDYLVVHWFVFMFDLTVALWMMWSHTRHVAMIFCALFHLMNSRLFRIGMFPWVCLATMPLFYPFDWPKIFLSYAKGKFNNLLQYLTNKHGNSKLLQKLQIRLDLQRHYNKESNKKVSSNTENNAIVAKEDFVGETSEQITCDSAPSEGDVRDQYLQASSENEAKRCKKATTLLILLYALSQAFLPYSHFITQGYNNWTNGLYGYSWDMMVHTWDTYSVIVKITDNSNNEDFYIDPYYNTPNDRWTRHGDMVYQYANCLKDRIEKKFNKNQLERQLSDNISIYIDVWCSMNGRFTQRMFDPKVDLLRVSWSPFKPNSYLMPLLDEALHWRSSLSSIKRQVYSQNNISDVLFIADFPGYEQEKYIPSELINATITVLEGSVAFVPEVSTIVSTDQSYVLSKGDQHKLDSEKFHQIINIGKLPVYYMYTFTNSSETETGNEMTQPNLPIVKELSRRLTNMFTFCNIVFYNLNKILFLWL